MESEDIFDQFFSSQGKVLDEMTRYIPPVHVVRLEDDEELEDELPQQEDGLESEYIPPVVRLVRSCITTAGRWIRI